MKKQLLRKVHWKHLLMFFACLISMIKAQAQSYDFKAANDEGITIYYVINGDDVSVTFGDQKYIGNIKIPAIVNNNGNTYNVTSIGKNAFYYCQSLESVELSASITKIDEYAFYDCESLKSVTISTNVRSIGDNAFAFCKSLESMAFPENLESIGQYVFNGCGMLASISIPANVGFIGTAAFANTKSLSSITVDGKNAVYDSRQSCNAIIETATNTLITGCKTTQIPDGVRVIGRNAFYYCQSLESVKLPASITKIDEYAFYECEKLKSATISRNVRSIGDNAFSYCKSLESIDFPENLESIGQYVFNGCGMLASISIPVNVGFIGTAAFANTKSLSSITVDGKNTVYDSRQSCNAIIETATNTLITGCKTTQIPDGVRVIGRNAFYYCQSLESVELPASITKIDEYAFYECGSLKSATIPANVRYIGDNAYGYCKSIDFVESLVEVPFEIDNNVFYQDTKEMATLYVPKGSKSTYQSTKGWEFVNVVEKESDDDNNNNNSDSNNETNLVVWAKDGSKVAFALSKRPKVSFTGTDLIITGKDIEVNYALDKMSRFTYEIVDATVVKDIKTEKAFFQVLGDALLFPALKANSTVSVYSLNGILVFKEIVRTDGDYSFPLSSLNVGVYLVTVNGITYKIVKR